MIVADQQSTNQQTAVKQISHVRDLLSYIYFSICLQLYMNEGHSLPTIDNFPTNPSSSITQCIIMEEFERRTQCVS